MAHGLLKQQGVLMPRPNPGQYIAQARAQYCNDDLEIDDDPKLSDNGEGCWVAAWVWVSDEEAEEQV
jgi:hypothetical protein